MLSSKRFLVTILLGVLQVAIVRAEINKWSRTGPVGGTISISTIAVDPKNPNIVLAGSFGSGVFRSTDGGQTWLEQQSNVDADLMDVKFIDAAEGWAIGSQGVLLHTTNGGARWAPESSGTTHALERLFFVDQSHGWAVGFGGTILRYGPSSAPQLK